MEKKLIRVGITQGDLAGVGYEIILKTFADQTMCDMCIPVVYGMSRAALFYRNQLGLTTNFTVVQSPAEAQPGRLNLINCSDEDIKISPGYGSAESGHAALVALQRAVEDMKQGNIDVLVTAPINKNQIHSDEFEFTGHTEYLQHELGEGKEALMILMSPVTKVALVTTHLPVSEIAKAITKERVERKIEIFNKSLNQDFTISMPRIAVLSLNPHAGDGGLLGKEEEEVIQPAIAEMQGRGVKCFGPYAADGFFGAGLYSRFDGVLAMYHDQGLAPFKALSGEDGVNFTAGLPIVRTSPDHGTAYDIAGKGEADENSFRQAVYVAIDVWINRQHDREAYANPMKIQELREHENRGSRREETLQV